MTIGVFTHFPMQGISVYPEIWVPGRTLSLVKLCPPHDLYVPAEIYPNAYSYSKSLRCRLWTRLEVVYETKTKFADNDEISS